MRSRMSRFGRVPTPACMLSVRCCTLLVAGMAQVTAGWEITNFNKNCAQVAQPISLADGGRGLPCNRLNNPPRGKRAVYQHSDAPIGGHGQEPALGVALDNRIIKLYEVEIFGFQDTGELVVGACRVVCHANVANPALLLPAPEGCKMRLPVH